jgi:26S proteasome regulatory subunit N1
MAILMEYVNKDDSNIRIGAILGLGIAYAGSQKDEVGMSAFYCLPLPYR